MGFVGTCIVSFNSLFVLYLETCTCDFDKTLVLDMAGIHSGVKTLIVCTILAFRTDCCCGKSEINVWMAMRKNMKWHKALRIMWLSLNLTYMGKEIWYILQKWRRLKWWLLLTKPQNNPLKVAVAHRIMWLSLIFTCMGKGDRYIFAKMKNIKRWLQLTKPKTSPQGNDFFLISAFCLFSEVNFTYGSVYSLVMIGLIAVMWPILWCRTVRRIE